MSHTSFLDILIDLSTAIWVERPRYKRAYRDLLPYLPKAINPGPVLVLPGFMSHDFDTKLLRDALNHLGYTTYGWNNHRNYGPSEKLIAYLRGYVRQLAQKHGKPVTIIGWSLGGIYARFLADMEQESVEQIITLGSPFGRQDGQVNPVLEHVYAFMERLNKARHLREAELHKEPRVPGVYIASKDDRLCHWTGCLQEEAPRRSENLLVQGSHCGLAWNLSVLAIIADRLATPPHEREPYDPAKYSARVGSKVWRVKGSTATSFRL